MVGSIDDRILVAFWDSLSDEERALISDYGVDWTNPRTKPFEKQSAMLTFLHEANTDAYWTRINDMQNKELDTRERIADRNIESAERTSFLTSQINAAAYLSGKKAEINAFVSVESNRTDKMVQVYRERTEALENLARDALQQYFGAFQQAQAQGGYRITGSHGNYQLASGNEPHAMHVTVGQCVMGQETLTDAVLYSVKDDGNIHEMCKIARAAHTRNRGLLQMFSEDKLKNAKCPLYGSRDLWRQIVDGVAGQTLGGFITNPGKCYLSDGLWHIVGEQKISWLQK